MSWGFDFDTNKCLNHLVLILSNESVREYAPASPKAEPIKIQYRLGL
jgi:hypothetical protein